MKTQVSALDIHYLIRELQILINSKVDKIYHPTKKEILLQLHIPNSGKKILRIVVPNYFHLTNKKSSADEPSGFCMFLRKHLDNSRVRSISQVGFERIVEILFETKEGVKKMHLEFFLKGNIIVSDGQNIIMSCEENQIWNDRVVKPKVEYSYPKKEYNLLELKEPTLRDIFRGTIQKSVVKTLAIDLGLGGIYSEEVCLLSGIDKNELPSSFKEIGKLFVTIKKIRDSVIDPKIIIENGDVKDIVPFEMLTYKKYETKNDASFNEALDKYLPRPELTAKPSKYQKEIGKLRKIIQQQNETIISLSEKDNRQKEAAEVIYTNYKLVDEILKTLKDAMAKHSLREIKERLKGHKIIKDFDTKEKTIVVDIK